MSNLPTISGFFIPDSEQSRIPVILARWFAFADSEDQQRFLEHIYNEVTIWERDAVFQWSFLKLSKEAKEMLREIADHAQDIDGSGDL